MVPGSVVGTGLPSEPNKIPALLWLTSGRRKTSSKIKSQSATGAVREGPAGGAEWVVVWPFELADLVGYELSLSLFCQEIWSLCELVELQSVSVTQTSGFPLQDSQ